MFRALSLFSLSVVNFRNIFLLFFSFYYVICEMYVKRGRKQKENIQKGNKKKRTLIKNKYNKRFLCL